MFAFRVSRFAKLCVYVLFIQILISAYRLDLNLELILLILEDLSVCSS